MEGGAMEEGIRPEPRQGQEPTWDFKEPWSPAFLDTEPWSTSAENVNGPFNLLLLCRSVWLGIKGYSEVLAFTWD